MRPTSRVKGKWVYLYRAVDSTGATIDFLLSAKRDTVAAKRFLGKALGAANHPLPQVINTDKDAAYPPAIVQLKVEGVLEENCGHRPVQYLNNVLEQDHRAIKRRVRASQHFRSFWAARRTNCRQAEQAVMLQAEDIATAALFAAGLPPRATVSEMTIVPTDNQAWRSYAHAIANR